MASNFIPLLLTEPDGKKVLVSFEKMGAVFESTNPNVGAWFRYSTTRDTMVTIHCKETPVEIYQLVASFNH